MMYAIRMPDGRLITDPEWHSPADVMRGAHGHGVDRMPGELVRLDDEDPVRPRHQGDPMTDQHQPEQDHVLVTASDPKTGDSDTQRIWDDYCLVAVGSAEVTNIQVHAKSDGTATHVITVKGVRRG